jgi:hypothetical protein
MKNWPAILIVCTVMLMATFLRTEARHKDDVTNAQEATTVSAVQLKCAKCQGDMEDGFLLENQGDNIPYTFTELIPGPPKNRFLGGVETKGKLQVHAITALNVDISECTLRKCS